MEAIKTNIENAENRLNEKFNNLQSNLISEITNIVRDIAVPPSHITTNNLESMIQNCLERVGIGALRQNHNDQNEVLNEIAEPAIETVDTVNNRKGVFRRPIPSNYPFPVRESPRQMWFLWHQGNISVI